MASELLEPKLSCRVCHGLLEGPRPSTVARRLLDELDIPDVCGGCCAKLDERLSWGWTEALLAARRREVGYEAGETLERGDMVVMCDDGKVRRQKR